MKEKINERAKDPLWVRCCELWDELEPFDREIVVKAMEYMAEKAEERRGGGGGSGEG